MERSLHREKCRKVGPLSLAQSGAASKVDCGKQALRGGPYFESQSSEMADQLDSHEAPMREIRLPPTTEIMKEIHEED
jgi:hypothetical protein